MIKNGYTISYLPVVVSAPVLSAPATKPTKTTSAEVIDPRTLLTPPQVKQLLIDAISGNDQTQLFGGMVLDVDICNGLPEEWIYAYYLNARYGRAMPVSMLPIRINSNYSTTGWLLGPLAICSAILSRLWDQTASTINPTIKKEHDSLSRCLVQLNYVIYQITQSNPTLGRPTGLIVSALQAYDKRTTETSIDVWVDSDALVLWESAGGTLESAVEHWVVNKTQPI